MKGTPAGVARGAGTGECAGARGTLTGRAAEPVRGTKDTESENSNTGDPP